MDETEAIDLILKELSTATDENGDFHSAHEGYAVIEEELDELWANVKLKPKKNPNRMELCKKEAIQIAAMAVRFLVDLC